MDIAGDLTTTTTLLAGESLTSDLGFLGDIDVVYTSLIQGISYGFSVSTTDTQLDLRLRLLDAVGDQLASTSVSNGSTASIDFSILQTGAHFLEVSDSLNNDIGDFTLSIDDSDTILNSILTTTGVDQGVAFHSNLDVVGDLDVLAINGGLVEGLSYGFSVSTTDPALDLRLRLLDASGAQIDAASAANGATASFDLTATSSDAFFLEVGDSLNNDTGDYTLLVDNSDTILNSIATTTTFGGGATFSSSLDVRTDIDVISVGSSLSDGLTYGFTATTANPELDLYFLLLDDAGGVLAGFSAFNGADAVFAHTVSGTDPLYLQISDISSNDIGSYTITIDDSDTIQNTFATTTSLGGGEVLNSAIDVVKDVDVIAVSPTLTTGLTYGFSATTTDAQIDLNLQLLDDQSTIVRSSTAFDGNAATFTFTANGTDPLYLQINDVGQNDAADYTLSIDDSDTILDLVSTGETMAIASRFASAIDVTGDGDMIAVDVIAGEVYEFTAATGSVSADMFLQVLNVSGGSLASGVAFDGNTASVSYTAAITQTLYLRISDSGGNDTGDYTIIATSKGNDLWTGDAGGNEIHGGAGKDKLVGLGGDDTLLGGLGNDVLEGGVDNDSLLGDAGRDNLKGGKGDDTLEGGELHDKLTGGRGDDLLLGGAGKDKFVFNGISGNDTIGDFQNGRDKIDILSGAVDFGDLTVEQVGDDVLISFASTTITLLDTQEVDITGSDFLF